MEQIKKIKTTGAQVLGRDLSKAVTSQCAFNALLAIIWHHSQGKLDIHDELLMSWLDNKLQKASDGTVAILFVAGSYIESILKPSEDFSNAFFNAFGTFINQTSEEGDTFGKLVIDWESFFPPSRTLHRDWLKLIVSDNDGTLPRADTTSGWARPFHNSGRRIGPLRRSALNRSA